MADEEFVTPAASSQGGAEEVGEEENPARPNGTESATLGDGIRGDWTQDDEYDVSTDVDILRRVWSNEKAAPEILAYEEHLVIRVQEQIALMEENIAAFASEITDDLMLSLYRMDVNRTLFLLRSYMRTRLSKIQKYPVYITRTPDLLERLSEAEQEYAYIYAEVLAKHLEQSVLTRMPDPYQSMLKQTNNSEEEDMLPKPELDTFVFCRSKGTIGSFPLDDKGEEMVELVKDDLHILRYKPVRQLLETNRIDLI